MQIFFKTRKSSFVHSLAFAAFVKLQTGDRDYPLLMSMKVTLAGLKGRSVTRWALEVPAEWEAYAREFFEIE